jgi:hypothetical protein
LKALLLNAKAQRSRKARKEKYYSSFKSIGTLLYWQIGTLIFDTD